eukprot:TRINITY_DN572_c0_g1_i4.p1 TRINITY_DN572_c0_g1~~TRINITY_DN572_c0_g1_i4.p1  ORF type:complete len:273 (+),score=54.35 TRINITY_DN572_c0_g1_i4:132-950(+)
MKQNILNEDDDYSDEEIDIDQIDLIEYQIPPRSPPKLDRFQAEIIDIVSNGGQEGIILKKELTNQTLVIKMKDFDPNCKLLQLYPNTINVFEFCLPCGNFPFEEPKARPVDFPDFTLEEISSCQWTPVMSILDYLKAIKKNLSNLGHFHVDQNLELKRRILIVDPNVFHLKIMHDNLSMHGYYSCDVSTNGYEAIELASKFAYHAVIIEYSLSLMNGLETALKIRDENRHDTYPQIIVLSPPDAVSSSYCNVEILEKPIYSWKLTKGLGSFW